MSPTETLQRHQELCEEIHALALEEHRYLQQYRSAPNEAFLTKKKALLERLDQSLVALRAVPRDGAQTQATRIVLEKTRSRILQVLQLDKENEQMLLRISLQGAGGAKPAPMQPSAHILQKIYQSHP